MNPLPVAETHQFALKKPQEYANTCSQGVENLNIHNKQTFLSQLQLGHHRKPNTAT